MNEFFDGKYLGPRFIIFEYFIKWYIYTFGFWIYLFTIVASVIMILTFFLIKNLRQNENDRVMMILILMVILVGGLIGVGLDISKGFFL